MGNWGLGLNKISVLGGIGMTLKKKFGTCGIWRTDVIASSWCENNQHPIKYALTRTVQRYGMMRIEAATAQIQANALEIQTTTTTAQVRSAVADGFARAHEHASPHRVSDQNTLAFLGSAPVILSTLPPRVQLSEHLVYRSYITVQVSKIDTLFKALAFRGSYPIEEPDSFHLEPFLSFVWLKPSTDEEVEDVQTDIFTLILKTQESLKTRDNQPSIQRGADAMHKLSVWLSNLGMDQESLTIAHCAVDLYRTLNKTNEDVYGPRLAHALYLMSCSYVSTRNVIEAYKAITEAVTLGRRLADASPTFEAQIQLAGLVSYSGFVGRRNGDWTSALKDAEEAVQSYQGLIGNPELMLRAEVGIAEGLQMTLEGTHVCNYADALNELHYNLLETTRDNESVNAGVQALELYRVLEQKHNHGDFGADIADLCSSLANDFREIVTDDQALLYAQESIQHYEMMLRNTGVVPVKLPSALGFEIKLLSRLERFDEAYGVCRKLARMIQIQMHDQHLRARSFLQLIYNLFDSRHYDEAVLIVESWSTMHPSLFSDQLPIFEAYNHTSSAFARIGDYSKPLQVAEASVSHWRKLALQSKKYLQYVAMSVHLLTRTYFRAKDYERAFKEGGEALKLYSGLISEDATLLADYIDALELNTAIARNAKMELESLERSRLVVQYSRALVKQFPDEYLFLIHCIQDCAILLEGFDHLADASVAISEALDWFDDHPALNSESAELHTNCLIDSARFLRLQGYPDRARSLYEKTSVIGQPFLDADSVAENILWAKGYNLLTCILWDKFRLRSTRLMFFSTSPPKTSWRPTSFTCGAWTLPRESTGAMVE